MQAPSRSQVQPHPLPLLLEELRHLVDLLHGRVRLARRRGWDEDVNINITIDRLQIVMADSRAGPRDLFEITEVAVALPSDVLGPAALSCQNLY